MYCKRIYIVCFLVLLCVFVSKAQTIKMFNGQLDIYEVHSSGTNQYNIKGYFSDVSNTSTASQAQIGDDIIDANGNMYQILSVTVNGTDVQTITKGFTGKAPIIGVGIIYQSTASGFPISTVNSSAIALTNALNTATISIDASIPKYSSGAVLLSQSWKDGDVVQYSVDSKLYRLVSATWSIVSNSEVSISYDDPQIGATPGAVGKIVRNGNDGKYYISDGSAWAVIPSISPLPTISKFGDVFYNTTDSKLYMMGSNNKWSCISTATMPGGPTVDRPITGTAGDFYYDTDVSKLYFFTKDGSWEEISINGSTPSGIINPDPASVKVNEGDLFYNTSDHRLYVYNGTAWIPNDNSLGSGQIFVGNSSGIAVPVTMSGDATVNNAGKLTINNAAVTDAKLDKANIPLNGFAPPIDNVAMGNGTTNNRIINLANPTAAQDAATKGYVDLLFSNPTTSLALPTGNFFVGNSSGKAIATPKTSVPLSGFAPAAADIQMGNGTINYKISNLLDPVSPQDAVTKNYVDSKVTQSGTALPGSSKVGDTFYNITDGKLYIYNGTAWVPVNNTLPNGQLYVGNASNVATATAKTDVPISGFGNAKADVTIGDGTTNYKITNVLNPVANQDVATKSYVDSNVGTTPNSPTQPSSPKPGDTYYDTTKNTTYVYNGTTWVPIDNSLPNGQLYVGNTLGVATATAKTDIPISGFGNAKTDVAIGDGTTNYKITNVLNPSADQDVATKNYVDSKVGGTQSGGTFPTTPAPKAGDTFYNTGDNNLYVYNGTAWVPVTGALPNGELFVGNTSSVATPTAKNAIPISGFGAATTDVAIGSSSTVTYKIANVTDPSADQEVATKHYVDSKAGTSPSSPTQPTLPKPGDTYYDTTTKNTYVYNGTTWVPVGNTLPTGQLYVGNSDGVAAATPKSAIPISGFGAAATDVAIGSSSTATYKITNVTDPSADQEVATKHYVDSKAAGGDMKAVDYDAALIKEQVVGLTATQILTNKTLDSPTMTGTPTAPTAVAGTNTTQVATTAFVSAALGGSSTFSDDFKINGVKNFLKWTDGQTVPAKGKTAIQLLLEGASQAVAPTYTAPTVAISSTPAGGSFEYGANIGAITLSSTFTQNDGGAESATTYSKNGTALSGNADNITSLTAPVSYTVTKTYAQGSVKINNLGNPDPTGQITAGSVTSSAVTYTPFAYRYYGLVSSQTPSDADIQALQKDQTNSRALATTLSYTPSASKYVCFRYPASLGAPTGVTVNGFPSTSAFTISTSTFVNAQGYSSSYYLIIGKNAVVNTIPVSVVINIQ